MEQISRYQKRKQLLENSENLTLTSQTKGGQIVNNTLLKNTSKKLEDTYNVDSSISAEEVKAFVKDFQKEFDEERFDKLVLDCRNEVIRSIVTPFGLGNVVAAYDKTGGNVTTVHNANQKIYANTEDEYNRNDYTNTKNSNDKQFAGQSKKSVGSNFTKSQMDSNGNVTDAYTGNTQKADTTSPDHIESLSQHHKNGAFMQDKTKKADFATDEDNLALTDRSINQSMRDFEKHEWAEKETEKGIKNKDKFDIDEKKLDKEVKKGKKTSENHLPTDMEKTKYYAKKSAITGMNEGAKMGMQQALGLVITEFFTALFDEISDIYKNGFSYGFEDDRFFIVLKDRLKKIATRISARWEDAAIAFKDGFISGFISNLATTVINMFVTTGKRVVRIIREGIFSLFRAVKMLINPPENMTYEEAMHEASKLLATGVLISLGLLLEEYVDKLIIEPTPILKPYADVITTILIGTLTGLAVTMTVYYLDKKRDDKKLFQNLLKSTNEDIEQITKSLQASELAVIKV